MDPISLALGIAPLCLTALKGLKLLRTKVKILGQHGSEVSRFRRRLRTQSKIFRDEFQLLLQDAGVDQPVAVAMLDDYSHASWASADLESQLREYLGRKYDELRECIEQIASRFEFFDNLIPPADCGVEGSKLSAAREAIDVMRNKTRVEEGIESLAELIHEFTRLRNVANKFDKARSKTARRRREREIPQTYQLAAAYTTPFFNLLVQNWSCLNLNGTQSKHAAKLLLDADFSENCLNFRLSLRHESASGPLKQHMLLVRVCSGNLSWGIDTPLLTPEYSPVNHQPDEEQEPPAKAGRVRFAGCYSRQTATVTRTSGSGKECQTRQQQPPSARNLCGQKDVCHLIFETAKVVNENRQETCIGYLRSEDRLTHRLMTAQDRESRVIQTNPCSPTSLASVIEPSRETDLSVHEQLGLALRLARAILQYHSAPWWPRSWCLSDLSYFDVDSDLAASLNTLHIDAPLPSTHDRMTISSSQLNIPSPPADDDARISRGIRNVTLYNLGVALVQIGWWRPFHPNDIVQVRKTAERKSRLGPRYDELVKKCLYCDFGSGDDLDRPELKAAVYQSVVRELEEMVELLQR